MMRRECVALVALSVCVACDKPESETPEDEGIYAEMPYCEETVSSLSPEDAPFGVSGAELLMAIEGTDGQAVFADGHEVGFGISFQVDEASLRLIESEAVYPDSGGATLDIAVLCADRIEVDASVVLDTADLLLDEAWSVAISVADDEWGDGEPGVPVFSLELEPDDLQGSLDLADYADLERYDEVSLFFDGVLSPSGFEGELVGQGSAEDGDVAFAETFAVASLRGDVAD